MPTKSELIENSWYDLFQKVKRYDLGLFVGAGLSIANRMPSWVSLTASLANSAGKTVTSLANEGVPLTSQLGIAHGATLGSSGAEEWTERVRKALYRGFTLQLNENGLSVQPDVYEMESNKGRDVKLRRAVRAFFEKTNPALVEIISMCSVRGKKDAAPRIVAVLTTNLDSLLQICDRAIHGSPRKLRTIERATKSSDIGKISLYHLNGYLTPYKKASASKEAADRLVLTEAEYTRRNDSPNHWAATTLHFVLRECPVLFVGCSMDDELVRRALYRTCAGRLTDVGAEREERRIARLTGPKHFVVRKWPRSTATRDALVKSYELMDVSPVWVGAWKDLPVRLRQLRETLEK